ncbi:hypothetical protein BDV96DRAFT_592083, partial [Lophiotrema nucula]
MMLETCFEHLKIDDLDDIDYVNFLAMAFAEMKQHERWKTLHAIERCPDVVTTCYARLRFIRYLPDPEAILDDFVAQYCRFPDLWRSFGGSHSERWGYPDNKVTWCLAFQVLGEVLGGVQPLGGSHQVKVIGQLHDGKPFPSEFVRAMAKGMTMALTGGFLVVDKTPPREDDD